MAGNGYERQLEQLEKTITGVAQASVEATNSTTDATDGDVQRYAEALAERVRAAGQYAEDHGAYLGELSRAFAEKITAETDQWATNVMAAEDRKQTMLKRLMGRFGG